jgi:hypothetical protein
VIQWGRWPHDVNGVQNGTIQKINGVQITNIARVNDVE